MKSLYLLLGLFAFLGSAFAKNHDLFFHEDGSRGLCVSYASRGVDRRNASDSETCSASTSNNVRIRVVNPPANADKKYGFDLVRPFFILDGIYLATDSLRTLTSFHEETMQFGLTDMLIELGYTPVLVQFSETVRQDLRQNALYFSSLLHFVNENKFFGFPNKTEDGMIVFGISQGGVLGRYGAYQYDIGRKNTEAPIRVYGSLDSPHQGAVMPMGLFYSIDFWALNGGSAAAEEFSDLIHGPGASGLLIVNELPESGPRNIRVYEKNFSENRFLYGEYRKAVDYNKFPAILIAQGQMKGKSSPHSTTYFKLNRKATKAKVVVGRAISEMGAAEDSSRSRIAYSRVYQIADRDIERETTSKGSLDFVQGSTYPFAKKMYESLRAGFLASIPDSMTRSIGSIFGDPVNISLATSWASDTLIQGKSTFIPVTSALDLNCDGDLSIRRPCAFSEKYSDVSFANPGSRSSATAMYAVDPTHPRYNEPESGRHIEMPVNSSGIIDTAVLRGMQVDIWRFMCEVAKYDYNESNASYRNEKLMGVFDPTADCMDSSKIPEIIRISGLRNTKKFGFVRYDYNKYGSEFDPYVSFDVPAGWHKVASFDNGSGIMANGEFVVDVTVHNANSNWMKAELLMFKTKNGAGQLQLQEQSVPVDGVKHTLRWPINFAEGSISSYRWFRLVLNSDGGSVTLSNPHFERAVISETPPSAMMDKTVYPNSAFYLYTMAGAVTSDYSDGFGVGLKSAFKNSNSAVMIDFGEKKNLSMYKNVKVSYWPGTCQKSTVYFDTYKSSGVSLQNGYSEGALMAKTIPLSSIINTDIIPNHEYAASRFVIQSRDAGETCVIQNIELE